MNKKDNTISVTIDNKLYRVPKGFKILQAAEQNNIYIPTLCAHKDLSPYGGCRMCIVEVEGVRNFPTACTTPLEDGMIVRTNTAQVQSMRMDVLQLFLSEHTSSCLVCDERNECREYLGTIRKAGVTTGCRYCPKDGQCELQEVAEKLSVNEIKYPVYYRNLRVENEDPFYERNYNLCILCGRCVRICQEVRTANVLAFKQRGRDTIIGPAHDRTHLEAGCEFCGACVSVCPTGSLSEKARKWEGKPDREEITTCSFCGVGCQLRLLIKDNRIIGSLPAKDDLINNGQLCVKGRFCITELVNGYERLKRPYKTFNGTRVEITSDEAIELAAEKLSACSPEDFGMLISPNCSNEDLYIAQKFVRTAIGSHNIDTSARIYYGSGFNAYLKLMKMSVPLSELQKASVVLCIGLDTRFGRSVVGVELRKAIKRGAKIITIHPEEHNLTLIAEEWLQPIPGKEIELFNSLADLTVNNKSGTSSSRLKKMTIFEDGKLHAVARMLIEGTKPIILIGSEFIQYDNNHIILEAIKKIAININAGVMPLPAQNNLAGSILTGVYSELLPGGYSSTNKKKIDELRKKWQTDIPYFSSQWNTYTFLSGEKKKVLYLIGELPPGGDTQADFLIYQNIYPPGSSCKADLVLPSAAFTEADGSFVNGEGRIQRVRQAVNPPGNALPDWKTLCLIAQKMGIKGFDFTSAAEIRKELSGLVKEFEDFEKAERNARPLSFEGEMITPPTKVKHTKKTDRKFPYLLRTSIVEHTHRGFPLSAWVDGAKKILTKVMLDINPDDARKAGISDGDEVIVSSANFEKSGLARILNEQPSGTLNVTIFQDEFIGTNPHPVRIRKKNV